MRIIFFNLPLNKNIIKRMKKSSTNNTETFATIVMGVLAIFLLKSLFENDNSKIVSKKGLKILSDKDKMNELNKKIISSEQSQSKEDIVI